MNETIVIGNPARAITPIAITTEMMTTVIGIRTPRRFMKLKKRTATIKNRARGKRTLRSVFISSFIRESK